MKDDATIVYQYDLQVIMELLVSECILCWRALRLQGWLMRPSCILHPYSLVNNLRTLHEYGVWRKPGPCPWNRCAGGEKGEVRGQFARRSSYLEGFCRQALGWKEKKSVTCLIAGLVCECSKYLEP